ncbi:MAG: aminoacyl-tRNA hydrolase [Candidatus Riflebacteria bacterium]|nr:aminoacyl-tRNA hydrolase [Candidatus Riflebacteria bacterium]
MIIAGLGNPGIEYQDTRHNAGFWAVEALARKFSCAFTERLHRAQVASFRFKGAAHLLVKPQTYMNLSGESVTPLLASEQLVSSDLLVIADDINLPVGRWRLRSAGGHGGHNGLKSIIAGVGEEFWRLRIGVGTSPGTGSTLVDHVLGPLASEERAFIDRQLSDLSELVCMWLAGMGQRAMGRFNGRNYGIPEPIS